MELTRRDFLKASAAGAGPAAWATFGFDMEPAYAQAHQLKISRASEIRSVCPYCAVGFSMIAYVTGLVETQSFNTTPHLIHIEGDPDSPINGGSLCPKGASTMQLAVNSSRVPYPKYRAPGDNEWQEISWEEALNKLARLIRTRATAASSPKTVRTPSTATRASPGPEERRSRARRATVGPCQTRARPAFDEAASGSAPGGPQRLAGTLWLT